MHISREQTEAYLRPYFQFEGALDPDKYLRMGGMVFLGVLLVHAVLLPLCTFLAGVTFNISMVLPAAAGVALLVSAVSIVLRRLQDSGHSRLWALLLLLLGFNIILLVVLYFLPSRPQAQPRFKSGGGGSAGSRDYGRAGTRDYGSAGPGGRGASGSRERGASASGDQDRFPKLPR